MWGYLFLRRIWRIIFFRKLWLIAAGCVDLKSFKIKQQSLITTIWTYCILTSFVRCFQAWSDRLKTRVLHALPPSPLPAPPPPRPATPNWPATRTASPSSSCSTAATVRTRSTPVWVPRSTVTCSGPRRIRSICTTTLSIHIRMGSANAQWPRLNIIVDFLVCTTRPKGYPDKQNCISIGVKVYEYTVWYTVDLIVTYNQHPKQNFRKILLWDKTSQSRTCWRTLILFVFKTSS